MLLNLGIDHRIRITKYNGRPNFQHVYPVVSHGNTEIIMDCVTDQFNYEVPYSEHKDFKVLDKATSGNLSGVDAIDLNGITFFRQPRLALRSTYRTGGCNQELRFRCYPIQRRVQSLQITKPIQTDKRIRSTGKVYVKSPFSKKTEPQFFKGNQLKKMPNKPELIFKTALVLGVGYGAYRLFSFKKTKRTTKKLK